MPDRAAEVQRLRADIEYGATAKGLDNAASLAMDRLCALATAPRPLLVEVVAAVRRTKDGRYWVCRRTDAGSHGGLAGMWEYPGGKVEDGESLVAALQREMHEEFGVECVVGGEIDCITTTLATQEYGNRAYRVHFFVVEFKASPTLRVHDATGWFTVDELAVQRHLPSGQEFNRRVRHYSALMRAAATPSGPRPLPDEEADKLHEAFNTLANYAMRGIASDPVGAHRIDAACSTVRAVLRLLREGP